MKTNEQILTDYAVAQNRYRDLGVDTDAAVKNAAAVPVSIHCWQGDDLTGFTAGVEALNDGGIAATGNFPGKAKNISQLQSDLDVVFSLVPGKKRLNLHSVYAETDAPIALEQIDTAHFDGWISFARAQKCGVDFNPTCFSHPLSRDGFTLASKDKGVREFWVEHVKNTRRIAAYIGEKLKSPCVHNLWIPDGAKDVTVDRLGYRRNLLESLDGIFECRYSPKVIADTLESKLFGLGSESFVAGSHDFYLLYALSRGVIPCMDMGHFHPTESVADKVSAMLLFFERILIHTSRGVRWDSDHVPVCDNELNSLMQEINRADGFSRVMIALDFFDASINRIFAWAVGARCTRKAILQAMLEPTELLSQYEREGRNGRKLALLEDVKMLPVGAVWDKLCLDSGVEAGVQWMDGVEAYEKNTLRPRG